ncbi:MAG: acyltransferase [Vicinamibacterales bacterium]
MRRSDVIDWLKATGISLIVYGHVAHATTVPWTPPIYVKQLGVTLFLFATGFTLARERRDPVEVLFNRLFPVYLFGLATALVITTWGLLSQTGLALSNYLPFLGGANVVFNNFPANPTTWYLGTYLHLLVLWAVWLRRVRLGTSTILALLVIEIPVRAVLITWAGPYIAYMFLTNWIAVFVAGLVVGGRPSSDPDDSAVPYAVALVGGLVVWSIAVEPLGIKPTFPFMTVEQWSPMLSTVAVSAAVSFLYLSSTLTAYAALRRVVAPAPVRFIARHSLIIFLVHMPVFLALNPVLSALHMTTASKVAVQLLVCLPGLAGLSAVVMGVVRPKDLRERLFAALNRGRRHAAGELPFLEQQ